MANPFHHKQCHTELENILDLTFLATGYCQHVFTNTAEKDGSWVYKIPAAFGYILPFRHTFRVFWPKGVYERFLCFALIRLPSGFHNRLAARAGSPLRAVSGRLVSAGERLTAAHCRRARCRMFLRMLELIRFLCQRGLDEVLLPCSDCGNVGARLRVGGSVFPYHGPMLVQRRAAGFETQARLAAFDWNDLVAAQHRLWRLGVGFQHRREILGPLSWAVFEGRLRLCDTSALSTEFRLVRRSLSKENLDLAERQAREHLRRCGSADLADDYFRFVRAEINQPRFDRLWRKDLVP